MAYLIFWGPSWKDSSGKLTTPGQIVTKYFSDVGGTNFENILTQYYMQNPDGSQSYIPNTLQFNSTHVWIDTSTPPSDNTCVINTIEDTSIRTEINTAITKKGWPLNEGNATYFVYTPSGYAVNTQNLGGGCSYLDGKCGYHNWIPKVAVYAELLYPGSGCTVTKSPNNNNDGDSLANMSSHEQFEATTNLLLSNGWYDNDTPPMEIGDKCAWNFPTSYTKLKNGGLFELQEEYSDATSSCVNTFTPRLTVNTTADFAPPCAIAAYSLRCAITQVNNDGSGKPIWFNIPSSNSGCKLTTIQGQNVYVCTITPASDLPGLTASNITIDGYRQTGTRKNTLSLGKGDNAIITVRIDGSKGVGGLVLTGNASHDLIQGLEITNFNYGILLYPNTVTSNSIVGNFIGTDGVNALGNNVGIYVSNAKYNTIGGTTSATANLVSGNKQEGIVIGAGYGETIEGNYIGTDRSGSAALPGSSTHVPLLLNNLGIPNGAGIYVFASSFGTNIGTIAANAANIIAHNTYGIVTDGGRNTDVTANKISSNYIGVYVQNGEFEDRVYQNTIFNNTDSGVLVGNSSTDHARVAIKQNSMYGNGGLGIDLSPQDTVNCSGPVSGAPNDYQPCPIIQSVTTTQVSGTATPKSFVEVYLASNEADDQGHGEGKTFLGSVYADTNGNWSLSVSLTSGNVVTAAATLTTQGVGETSEFAINITLT